jgi:replication factor C subunit 1
VTGQPSSKTSYVVLGENAGPSKLAAIKKNGLKTLSEDEFLELIGSRVGPSGQGKALDPKLKQKMEKEVRGSFYMPFGRLRGADAISHGM